MGDKRFWDVIGFACKHDEDDDFMDAWLSPLVETLATLAPDEIVRFDRWFDEKTDALYTRDHWAAASLINGGASDDGFYYWRCWLVGMGKKVYEAALNDPDTLADVVDPDGGDYEAEIYGAARSAWLSLRGEEDESEDEYSKVYASLGDREHQELTGEDWDHNRDEYGRRFPRLAAMYFDAEEFDDDEDFDEDDEPF